jgi:transposase InsO family protein
MSGPFKLWFSAAELAALGLPGVGDKPRRVQELAETKGWAFQVDSAGAPLARRRAGRGGGMEYHRSLLPASALTALVRKGLMAPQASTDVVELVTRPGASDRSQLWAWYERQSDAVKAEARRRAEILDAAELLVRAGLSRTAAIASAAAKADVKPSTVWAWEALARGVHDNDRLPKLAPRRRAGGKEAEMDDRAWEYFRSDYLRPEKPTIASCYDRLAQVAATKGWGELPHPKTFARKIAREVDVRVVTLQRNGAEALRHMLPPQQRTVRELHAMELVNIDGHKWDVFVRWPDGDVGRPIMVAIQDVYSRKTLAWRVGKSETAALTRLTFADLFKAYGIPKGCLLDNGRAFASKWITGGAKTRYRFKIREEEPYGLLPSLGVNPHWATPYRGQSKPIERSFQLVCQNGAKHPAFAGAYTGNSPDAKPENYGSKAVPLDVFLAVAAQVMATNNAKLGRRTEMANGRSYDQVFAESYATAPIGKATPEQLRIALLAAEQVSTDRKTGHVVFLENRYWTPELATVAGEKVVIRFDPDDLHSEVHVYRADGSYLATAPVIAATGFLDRDAAVARAKLEANHRKATRAARDAEQLLSAAQLADLLGDGPDDEAETPSAKVIRPVRLVARGGAATARKPEADPTPDFLDRFATGVSRLRVVE